MVSAWRARSSIVSTTGPVSDAEERFRITRELVASTIADMDLDPAALAEVEEAFIGLACCDSQRVTKEEATAP